MSLKKTMMYDHTKTSPDRKRPRQALSHREEKLRGLGTIVLRRGRRQRFFGRCRIALLQSGYGRGIRGV